MAEAGPGMNHSGSTAQPLNLSVQMLDHVLIKHLLKDEMATGTWTKWNPMANVTTKFLRVLYCQEPELQVTV